MINSFIQQKFRIFQHEHHYNASQADGLTTRSGVARGADGGRRRRTPLRMACASALAGRR